MTLLSVSLSANLTEDEGDWDTVETAGTSRPVGLAAPRPAGDRPNEARLAMQILDAECKGLRSALEGTLPPDAAAEAVAALEEDCRIRMAELERRAQGLDRGRGRRSWFRRTLVGRAFRWVGRQVVASLPDAALAMVTGGGGLAARRVIIQNARRALRAEARGAVSRLLARHGVSNRMLALAGLPPALRRTRSSPGPTPTATEVLDPESVEATKTAQAAELEELFSTGEKVIEVKITEAELAAGDAYLYSHQVPGQADRPSWCDTLNASGVATDLDMWIRFNLDTGKVTGEVGGTFACVSDSDCDEPGEFVRGRFDGVITDGWVRPDGAGGWEWGGELDAEASISAEYSCGKIIHQDTGTVEDFRIRGSTSMKLAGAFEGDSWGVPGADGPWFTLQAPAVDMPEDASYIAFGLSCYRPGCPMPEQFPPPPQ